MIRYEDIHGTRVLHLEHGKVNAIDIELLTTLEEMLDEAEGNTAAIVLTGNGRAFSAGVDLFRITGGDPAYISRFLDQLRRTLLRLFAFPLPVVAAVDGHAIAGGCILAAACDRRLMADGDGRIGVSELKVGVPFPTIALEVLGSLLSPHHLQDLVLTGRLLTPEQAHAVGLVDEVLPADQLLDRALASAADFAAVPGETWRLTKQCLRQSALERIAQRAEGLDDEIARQWRAPAVQQAIDAFLAKTMGRK